jgi:hypothetical protein
MFQWNSQLVSANCLGYISQTAQHVLSGLLEVDVGVSPVSGMQKKVPIFDPENPGFRGHFGANSSAFSHYFVFDRVFFPALPGFE